MPWLLEDLEFAWRLDPIAKQIWFHRQLYKIVLRQVKLNRKQKQCLNNYAKLIACVEVHEFIGAAEADFHRLTHKTGCEGKHAQTVVALHGISLRI